MRKSPRGPLFGPLKWLDFLIVQSSFLRLLAEHEINTRVSTAFDFARFQAFLVWQWYNYTHQSESRERLGVGCAGGHPRHAVPLRKAEAPAGCEGAGKGEGECEGEGANRTCACEDATSGSKGAVVLTVRECCQGYCLVCACEERAALNVGAVCLFML